MKHIIHYEETDSTNLRAKEGADFYPHGTLFAADRQTAGRGRRGRNWESSESENIYMSLLLKPEFEVSKAPMLTLVMAHSIAKALRERYQIEAMIKWPNDIVLNKKKVCGILTEMSVKNASIEYVIIGVGLNVGNREFPDELKVTATSLFLETGQKLSKERLMKDITEVFGTEYKKFCEAESLSPFLESYNQMLVNQNQEVVVHEAEECYHAFAEGINKNGELIIKKEDGTIDAIFAGEVSVRGIYGYV